MVEPVDEAESLSLPLRQYVDEDNRQFQEAIDNWNSQPTGWTSGDDATGASSEDAAVSPRAAPGRAALSNTI